MPGKDITLTVSVAKDEASRALREFNGDLSSTESSSSRLGSTLASGLRAGALAAATAVAALGAATVAAGIAGIKGAADFEQNRVAFDTMLGSADKAKSLMADIAEFAKTTPFELPEVVAGSKALLAFGVSAQDILPTMRRLGDVAAGIGAPVGELAELYGKAKTQGRLFAEDINQLTGRGIPIIQSLAKVLKTTESNVKGMVEQGKVGFPELEKAFAVMTDSGSQFGGMMDKQSKTLNGVFSNIQDGIGQMLRGAVGITNTGEIVEGGFFAVLKRGAESALPYLGVLTTEMSELGPQLATKMVEGINVFRGWLPAIRDTAAQVADYLAPNFAALGNTLVQDVLPALKTLWQGVLVPLLPILGGTLVVALGVAVDWFNFFLAAVSGVINQIREGNPVVLILAAAFGTLAAAMAIQATVTAVNTAMTTLSTVTIPALMGRVVALNTLLMTPMVMPAIVVAAALAAIYSVVKAYRDAQAEIEKTNKAIETNENSNQAAIRDVTAKYKAGKISKENYNRFMGLYGVQARASGGPINAGQPYLVGEQGPELVVPCQNGTVIPAAPTAQAMAGGGGVNIERLIVNNNMDVSLVIRQMGWALATR